MNNLKRLISMLLCMALMFTSVGVFADEAVTEEVTVAEETIEATEDAASEEVAEIAEEPTEEVEPIEIDWERIGLLETLGIIDEVDESTAQEFLSAQFSRAEFAVALVRFNNMEGVIGVGEGFNDVVPGSKEEPYINAAVNMGLIAAVTDGYFYPQYPISYQDAAQAFVMSLGYTAMAEINDSWLIQAKKLGLMSGIDTGAAFTRAQAYRMFYNALHADIMDVTGIEGNISNYETREGIDALYKFFNVKHEQGIIMAAGGIELSAGATVGKEYIKHNGKLYKYGTHSMRDYLGRNAVVYYSETGVASYVLRDKNEVLQIPQSELNGYNNLTYNYGADEETAKIANAYVIKNGEEYLGTQDQVNMVPVSGSVTLIDNNRDGVYDVVFIDEYVDYVIKLKLQNPRRIVDFFGNPITVDPSLSNVEFYDKDGKALDFDKLSTNTVASVMQSTSSTRVYISADSVTSTVSQTSQKLGKTVWKIDGKNYTMSKSLTDAIAATKIENPKLGQAYKFYLNIYGEIAYYEEAAALTGDDKFYAFITAAKLDGINNDEVTIKAFAKTFGGFQSLTLPKRVILNGSNATPEKVYRSLMRDGVDGRVSATGIIPQPVKIKVNENNEITYLAQAGVRKYYETLWQPIIQSNTISGYIQQGIDFPPMEDPTIVPEFELYMGHYDMSGTVFAYRNVIQFGAWNKVDPTYRYQKNKVPPEPFGDYNDWNANSVTGSGKLYKHMGIAENIQAYQVPYYKTGARAGEVAVEKEDFFKSAGVSTATDYVMYCYREGDSFECSYMTQVVDADTPSTVGDEFSLGVVMEISKAYVNEAPCTVLKMNTRTVYIEDGSIDLDNLRRYTYTNELMYESDGVTPMTYQVKPGDVVNYVVDALGYATAIEAVYDSNNQRFLADSDGYKSDRSRIANQPNRSDIHYAKRNDAAYMIKKMYLNRINGSTLECVQCDPAAYEPNDGTVEEYILTMIPNMLVKVENVRGTIETKNATKADLISYEDSKSEYVTILLASRLMALNAGSSYVYPHQ